VGAYAPKILLRNDIAAYAPPNPPEKARHSPDAEYHS
jgi:hypothetical protein